MLRILPQKCIKLHGTDDEQLAITEHLYLTPVTNEEVDLIMDNLKNPLAVINNIWSHILCGYNCNTNDVELRALVYSLRLNNAFTAPINILFHRWQTALILLTTLSINWISLREESFSRTVKVVI